MSADVPYGRQENTMKSDMLAGYKIIFEEVNVNAQIVDIYNKLRWMMFVRAARHVKGQLSLNKKKNLFIFIFT